MGTGPVKPFLRQTPESSLVETLTHFSNPSSWVEESLRRCSVGLYMGGTGPTRCPQQTTYGDDRRGLADNDVLVSLKSHLSTGVEP